MFIFGYLVILVLRANHIIVPHLVSTIFGFGAIVESAIYVISALAIGVIFWKELRD